MELKEGENELIINQKNFQENYKRLKKLDPPNDLIDINELNKYKGKRRKLEMDGFPKIG